jgi:AdoMet-dependent heme synthase
MHMLASMDFNQAPFLTIWEVTRACALACRHCRASAQDQRDPDELTTAEGRALLDEIAGMGTPIVIFTGGDPLQREDLDELIAHGKARGLRVGTIPAATPRLTRERVAALQAAGLDQMALSLDASTAAGHDELRQVPGSFAKVIEAAGWARELGLPLQINTTLGAWNVDDFDAIAALVESLGVVFWEVFFLVPTGRGAELQGCSAAQCEMLFGRLAELAKRAPYIVKITEAPHYRRYVLQQAGNLPPSVEAHSGQVLLSRREGPHRSVGLSPLPVNSAKGFCFVDHVGQVYPSGFLPIAAGSVRERKLSDIYRDAPIFRALRDPDQLKSRCGRCEYRAICGGSRSRAYALTGDAFEEDAACGYDPPISG